MSKVTGASVSAKLMVVGVTVYVPQDVCHKDDCHGHLEKIEFWRIGQDTPDVVDKRY